MQNETDSREVNETPARPDGWKLATTPANAGAAVGFAVTASKLTARGRERLWERWFDTEADALRAFWSAVKPARVRRAVVSVSQHWTEARADESGRAWRAAIHRMHVDAFASRELSK